MYGESPTCYKREAFRYDIRSFDRRKKRYAFQIGNKGELKILGTSQKLYPGLLECLPDTEKELDSLQNEM